MALKMERTLAQMIVVDRAAQRILLGLHTSGIWQGNYTGFLDEVGPEEDPASAAVRITREKASITVPPGEHRATFQFNSEAWESAQEFEFLVESHSGQPQESGTVRPEWFALDAIPYARMPADDALWYPPFLAGKRMRGHFDFAPDGTTLLRHHVEEIEADDLS